MSPEIAEVPDVAIWRNATTGMKGEEGEEGKGGRGSEEEAGRKGRERGGDWEEER